MIIKTNVDLVNLRIKKLPQLGNLFSGPPPVPPKPSPLPLPKAVSPKEKIDAAKRELAVAEKLLAKDKQSGTCGGCLKGNVKMLRRKIDRMEQNGASRP